MAYTIATQAHVNGGMARAVGNVIIHYDAPPTPFQNLRDAICASEGYQDEINGQPNPESKADFADRAIREDLRARERAYRVREAANAAADLERQSGSVDLE